MQSHVWVKTVLKHRTNGYVRSLKETHYGSHNYHIWKFPQSIPARYWEISGVVPIQWRPENQGANAQGKEDISIPGQTGRAWTSSSFAFLFFELSRGNAIPPWKRWTRTGTKLVRSVIIVTRVPRTCKRPQEDPGSCCHFLLLTREESKQIIHRI